MDLPGERARTFWRSWSRSSSSPRDVVAACAGARSSCGARRSGSSRQQHKFSVLVAPLAPDLPFSGHGACQGHIVWVYYEPFNEKCLATPAKKGGACRI
ncbi:unnamed protein product [Effrenium voratum]|nr:unnamed protein product [Effrenium voratum]